MYFLLLSLVLTLLSAGVFSAPVEWSLGTGLWLYVQINTRQGVTCPPTKVEADGNTNLCRTFVQNGKVLCNRNPGEAGRRVLNLNGFAGNGPLTQSTRLKVVELKAATGDGCWSVGQDGHVSVTPCALADGSQKLYLRRRDGNDVSYSLYSDHAVQPLSVSPDGTVVTTDNASPVFCMYETNQGNAVIPPSKDPSYFSPDQINALAGIKLPGSKDLQAEVNLPGCKGAKDTTVDCLIARVVNDLPPDCPANPHLRHCKLALVGAFCGDVPELTPGDDNSVQVEFCFRNIELGPCVANPPGRACSSGQFAGIVQFVKGDGGHSGQKHRRAIGGMANLQRRENYGSNRDLFSDQPSLLPAEDQFWVGVMKNIINGFIDLLNAFRASLHQSSHISCLAMAQKFPEGSPKGSEVRKGCQELFRPHKPIPNFPLQGDIEKAGNIFAEVVTLLSTVADVAKAAKAATFVGSGGVKAILKKFRPRPAIAADGVQGYVIEAKEGQNTVQIFRAGSDGEAVGIKNKAEYKELKRSIGQEAFDNCVTCAKPLLRLVRRQVGSPPLKKLCCRASPSSEASGGESDAVSEEYYTEGTEEEWGSESDFPDTGNRAETKFGALTNPAGQADTSRILPKMMDEFSRWFKKFEDIPLEADAVNTGWYKRLTETPVDDKPKIIGEFIAQYKVTEAESKAVTAWLENYEIDVDAFNTLIPKLPPVEGLIQRATLLDEATVNMLIKGEPGTISKGERGIYEVRDLVINDLAGTVDGQLKRLMMTSSLGFKADFNANAAYRFVINSRSGRFVAPFDPVMKQWDVLHLQGKSGKFKLIGYQPLNDGEVAKAPGKAPFGVFYFDEVIEASGSGGGGGGH